MELRITSRVHVPLEGRRGDVQVRAFENGRGDGVEEGSDHAQPPVTMPIDGQHVGTF